MSDDLKCPHCGRPFEFGWLEYDPFGAQGVPCRRCRRLAKLPLRARLGSLAVFLAAVGGEGAVFKRLGLFEPEEPVARVVVPLALFLVMLVTGGLAALAVSRRLTDRLLP